MKVKERISFLDEALQKYQENGDITIQNLIPNDIFDNDIKMRDEFLKRIVKFYETLNNELIRELKPIEDLAGMESEEVKVAI